MVVFEMNFVYSNTCCFDAGVVVADGRKPDSCLWEVLVCTMTNGNVASHVCRLFLAAPLMSGFFIFLSVYREFTLYFGGCIS